MQLFVVIQAVKDLLLSLVADGAGVVQNQAGVFLVFNLPVTLVLQCANHLFGVMGIHLAAEGFKIESFLGRHNNPEYTVICVTPRPAMNPASSLSLSPVRIRTPECGIGHPLNPVSNLIQLFQSLGRGQDG